MSIKQLSDQSGVPCAATHGLIHGTRDVVLSTASKLCKVLGLEFRQIKAKKRE